MDELSLTFNAQDERFLMAREVRLIALKAFRCANCNRLNSADVIGMNYRKYCFSFEMKQSVKCSF